MAAAVLGFRCRRAARAGAAGEPDRASVGRATAGMGSRELAPFSYAHYYSATSYEHKKQLVKATLTKLHKLCNDDYLLYHSALDKILELILLRYPIPLITTLCSLMAVRTRNVTWFKVRETIHSKSH